MAGERWLQEIGPPDSSGADDNFSMRGRHVSPQEAEIERFWHIGRHNNNPFGRRFNVSPTSIIPILRLDSSTGEIELVHARWGLTNLVGQVRSGARGRVLSLDGRKHIAAEKERQSPVEAGRVRIRSGEIAECEKTRVGREQ